MYAPRNGWPRLRECWQPAPRTIRECTWTGRNLREWRSTPRTSAAARLWIINRRFRKEPANQWPSISMRFDNNHRFARFVPGKWHLGRNQYGPGVARKRDRAGML